MDVDGAKTCLYFFGQRKTSLAFYPAAFVTLPGTIHRTNDG